MQCLVRLLVVLLELFIRDQRLRFLFHLPDRVEADHDEDEVNDRVDDAEVHHVDVLLQVVHVSVQADVVKQNHQERIKRTDRVVRLVLLNVHLVVLHYEQGLGKLDIMNEADELVVATILRALAEYAPEVDD